MADVFDRAKRSEVMSKIRGCGNKSTELVLVEAFREAHVTGWRRHVELRFRAPARNGGSTRTEIVKIRPDFLFRAARLAVFVDGCFWHCCPLHSKVPNYNHEFWASKLLTNVERDKRATRILRESGWRVFRVWEHELRDIGSVVRRFRQRLAIPPKVPAVQQ